ncbi:PaaI family thioesterase [Microbacterium sp. GXF7504]
MTGTPEHPDDGTMMMLQRRAVDDPSLVGLGVSLVTVDATGATMRLTVRHGMRNAWEVLHGGYTFALADTAFAYTCMAAGLPAVTRHADFTFVSAVTDAAFLDARGTVTAAFGRNIVVDVEVHDDQGTLIALGRLHGSALRGET